MFRHVFACTSTGPSRPGRRSHAHYAAKHQSFPGVCMDTFRQGARMLVGGAACRSSGAGPEVHKKPGGATQSRLIRQALTGTGKTRLNRSGAAAQSQPRPDRVTNQRGCRPVRLHPCVSWSGLCVQPDVYLPVHSTQSATIPAEPGKGSRQHTPRRWL